jgi:hypothetical protein
VPVVVSVLPEEAPIEPLLDEVLGVEVDELVSVLPVVLLEVLDDGEVAEDPLDEPVPEAPIDDELLGELEAPVDGEAPIVDEDEEDLSVAVLEGVLPAVLLLELGVLELVLGVLLLVPVLLPLVEPEAVPAPVDVPALPPLVPPEVWAMARPPKARAAAAARAVRVVLVALILNSLMELSARGRGGTEAGTAAGWTED